MNKFQKIAWEMTKNRKSKYSTIKGRDIRVLKREYLKTFRKNNMTYLQILEFKNTEKEISF